MRVVHYLGRKARDKPRVVLIGFPCDQGVKINRGRPGSADAPDSIRRMLYKLTPDAANHEQFCELLCQTRDMGNLNLSGDLHEDQHTLGVAVASFVSKGMIPIVLGGGHETSYGHFLGYVEADKSVQILNWDAHADVRELAEGQAHSGSPFRQAITHPSKLCLGYEVCGLQPYTVAKSHLEFIEKSGGRYEWQAVLNRQKIEEIFARHSGRTMVTFDMDCVTQAAAPGVSAPCATGLDPGLWLHAAFLAGRSESVSSLDLVEVNPKFDPDGHTARLAAVTVWHFLRGLAERKW